jgi:hypothetical protein
MDGNKLCPSGKIKRDGYVYTKKNSTKTIKVNSTCVKDKGKPGKGTKLIVIPEYDIGLLSKYGYSLKDSHDKRVKILKKAISANSELKILRHLNALRILQKSNDNIFKKLNKDFKWIQQDYKKLKNK